MTNYLMRVFDTKMRKDCQMLRFRAVDLSYKAGFGVIL